MKVLKCNDKGDPRLFSWEEVCASPDGSIFKIDTTGDIGAYRFIQVGNDNKAVLILEDANLYVAKGWHAYKFRKLPAATLYFDVRDN